MVNNSNTNHFKLTKTTMLSTILVKNCSTLVSTTTATKQCTVEHTELNLKSTSISAWSTTKDWDTWWTISPKLGQQDLWIFWPSNRSREGRKEEEFGWVRWREMQCWPMEYLRLSMNVFSWVRTDPRPIFATNAAWCFPVSKRCKKYQEDHFRKYSTLILFAPVVRTTIAVWFQCPT